MQAGRCNSAMQHVIVVYSRRQIGFSVCPSSMLKFKNERGKKIVTGAGSQVFSDRLGYPYFYGVDSMGAHRRARIHPPCSALPGRAPAAATCDLPLPIHQNGRLEGRQAMINGVRWLSAYSHTKNASTDLVSTRPACAGPAGPCRYTSQSAHHAYMCRRGVRARSNTVAVSRTSESYSGWW